MAGVNYNEKDIVDYAIENGYCSTGSDYSGANGNTYPEDRKAILEHYGIPCSLEPSDINSLASSIEQGKGVIIAIDPGRLCPEVYSPGNHAIAVTSVERDCNGNIKGFYVCDSNADTCDADSAYICQKIRNYYTADEINNAFIGVDMVVTDSPIR